jgi:hypothetical protein
VEGRRNDPNIVCTYELKKKTYGRIKKKKKKRQDGHLWLTPVILAIQEAEIRRIEL